MKREKTVTAYTCDCCGAEIDDRATASITMSLCHAAYFCKGWEDAMARLADLIDPEGENDD